MDRDKYISPFTTRYAGAQMQRLFSDDYKFGTWRRLWLALAKAEQKLGLCISDEQISELKASVDNINYEQAQEHELRVRHDVMAHVFAYGLQCPKAAPILHLGATSAYVVDNTDLIIMREAAKLLRGKAVRTVALLTDFAMEHKALPTLGYTHFQPAQLTTVGKRATLWIHDLLLDIEEIDFALGSLKFLGSKGTTGTQASFLELFEGDHEKVIKMEQMIAEEFGFSEVYPVSGQTYSRKVDSRFVNALGQLAQSCSKFANDLRLLQHLKEVEEPFESEQIGSSAMPYKRNPMRCERMNSLCRYVVANMQNTAMTASSQWFERTLDDSANKRVSVAEAFLAMDAALNTYIGVAKGLVVYPKMILKHLQAELPFMATENIMMDGVMRGGNRQDLHEAIRRHALAAAKAVKEDGSENDILLRISTDPLFDMSTESLEELLSPERFTGRSEQQVEEFVKKHVMPLLRNSGDSALEDELKV